LTRPEEVWRACAWLAMHTGLTRTDLMDMELEELSTWVEHVGTLVKQGHSALARG